MKRKIFATLLSLVVLAFSQICDAAIRFDVDGLTFSCTCILAPNDRTSYGQYVLMQELKEGESIIFSFDYDSSTGVFTLYRKDGFKYATEKFRDRNNIVFESYIWAYPSGVYTKERNGEYTYWADVDGKPFPHSMSDESVAGLLLFLDRNGDIGGFYDKSSVITVIAPINAPDQSSTDNDINSPNDDYIGDFETPNNNNGNYQQEVQDKINIEITTNDLTIAENGKATLKIGLRNDSQRYVWLKKIEFTVDVKNMDEGKLFTLEKTKKLAHTDIIGGNLFGEADGKKMAPGQEIFMDIKFKDSAIFVPQGQYRWSTSIQYEYSLNRS